VRREARAGTRKTRCVMIEPMRRGIPCGGVVYYGDGVVWCGVKVCTRVPTHLLVPLPPINDVHEAVMPVEIRMAA
jgi:hypothetical protein